MMNLKINFTEANNISNEIINVTADMSNISSSANGISAAPFASYSAGTVGLTEEFKSSLSKVVPNCENFSSKFQGYIKSYYEAWEEQQRKVEEEIKEGKVEDRSTDFYPEKTIASAGTVNFTISDDKMSEITEKNKFYFNYQGNVSEVKELSSGDLSTLFEKNGADRAVNGQYSNGHSTTRDGDGWYIFEKNGHTYEYNVNTNEIIVDYKTPSSIVPSAKFNCKFFTTGDTNFDDITNTITICGGQGILEVKDPRYDKDSARTLMTGVNTNKNSLVIIPYGRGYGTIGANIAPGVISSTVIGDFISGSNNKPVKNSIVGFSLGGQATYQALASSNGLYQKAVIVNSGIQMKNGHIWAGGSFENMKNTEIIIMQANNDQTFGDWAPGTVKRLVKGGVPPENITVYTNSGKMLKAAQTYLPSENIHDVSGEVSGRTWKKHNYGIDIIKTSGILNYLS